MNTLEQRIAAIEATEKDYANCEPINSGAMWAALRNALEIISELQQENQELRGRLDEALKELRLAQKAHEFNEIANHIFSARLLLKDRELLDKLNGDKNAV